MTHDLDKLVQSLLICTVSLDGDSSRYAQVVRTAKKLYMIGDESFIQYRDLVAGFMIV